jgi:4-coumarate--CoA ligase
MPFFHVGIAPQVFVPRFQITEMLIVRPMVAAIVMSGLADKNSENYHQRYSLRSVQYSTTGAAPCCPGLQKRFARLLAKGGTFSQVWGMTKTTNMAAIVPWDVVRKCTARTMDAWGNVGKPLPCMRMKLVDYHGADITESGQGELCVKGPTVVKGYFEDETATRTSWDRDGYFLTGGVVRIDGHGLMHVVGRMKELIKVRGFQVAPAELEGALTEHPHIVDAAVIGVIHPHDDDFEASRGYVVKREGVHLTENHVHEHMGERLARYKQLHGGVHFVETVPKSPSGKILRRVMRDKVREEEAARKTRPKL